MVDETYNAISEVIEERKCVSTSSKEDPDR